MVLAPEMPLRSAFAIYALVAIVLVTLSRASYQILTAFKGRAHADGAPALIYGAGSRGAGALRELLSSFVTALRPVGFIDDDPGKIGKLVNGVPVVGSFQTMESAIRRFAARAVVVSSDSIPTERLSEIGEMCERLGIALLRMQVSFDRWNGAPVPGVVMGRSGAAALDWPVTARSAVEPRREAMAQAAPIAAPDRQATRVAVDVESAEVRLERACVPGSRVPIVAGPRCPSCHSYRVHRSKARSVFERLQKRLTQNRLHRCAHCGWRGWRPAFDAAAYEALPAVPQQEPNLDSVDAVLTPRPSGAMVS
jgi:hypothetical protein